MAMAVAVMGWEGGHWSLMVLVLMMVMMMVMILPSGPGWNRDDDGGSVPGCRGRTDWWMDRWMNEWILSPLY